MSANPNYFSVDQTNTLLIRAAGDVLIRGWDQTGVELLCDGGRAFKEEPEQKLARVVAKGDLYLSVPAGMAVRVEYISGDALISGIRGRLDIQKASGDLTIEKCAQVDLGVTGGDLTVREIFGPFNIQRVSGDFRGEAIMGGLVVESVGGDSTLQIGGGGVRLRTGGDLTLVLPRDGAEEVVVKAGGDVNIHVAEEINAQLDLSSGGHDIRIEVPGHVSSIEEPTYSATLGSGARPVHVRSGGDLLVTEEVWDEDDLGDDIEEQINDWEERKMNLDSQHGDWDNFEQRIRDRTEAAARRAEDRVREAMDRVERQNRQRGDLFSRFGFNFNFPTPPTPPASPAAPAPTAKPAPVAKPAPMAGSQAARTEAQTAKTELVAEPDAGIPPSSGVSNDERMLVLKMLQEHKISIEEASQLLNSLEGNFD